MYAVSVPHSVESLYFKTTLTSRGKWPRKKSGSSSGGHLLTDLTIIVKGAFQKRESGVEREVVSHHQGGLSSGWSLIKAIFSSKDL